MNNDFFKKVIAVIFIIGFDLLIFKACTAIQSQAPHSSRPVEEIEKYIENYDYVEKFDVTKVSMESVDSSALSYVGYKNNKLVIMFNNEPNRCYVYSEVDYETYDELMYAESLGSYYNNYIKGKYECVRIDDIHISKGHIQYD